MVLEIALSHASQEKRATDAETEVEVATEVEVELKAEPELKVVKTKLQSKPQTKLQQSELHENVKYSHFQILKS